MPIGAYELLVLFGCQAAVVIGGIWLADFWAGFRRARQQGLGVVRAIGQVVAQLWGEGPRFPLRELLAGVLLAAAVLAIVRNGPVDAVATRDVLNNPGPWIAAGIALGITTLAAIGIVFGSAHWYVRLVVGLIVIVAAPALLELEEPALSVGSQFGLIAPGEATGEISCWRSCARWR